MTRAAPLGFEVEQGQPRDIFFFMTEVVSGSWHAHFGSQFRSLPITEKEFGTRCAKAILESIFPFWHTATQRQFVVIRHQNEVVGAALSYLIPDQAAHPRTCIEVVVVARRWRQQGIGRALVVYFQKHTPPEGLLECYCAPQSRTMARLIKHLGFVRTHKVTKVAMQHGRYMQLPERWEWQARPARPPIEPAQHKIVEETRV
ncbi:GNAT family N-acetyltransferase [Dyella acidisoli]|uniref:N-acetyltransferase domain-containing protein n=1 Tax=Dyella acidisoli TaxID=1867834 RepID=A0ABQ5XHV0_9GAMM|nr:GNAT family N-acetyltransferase [Dyella acidisoli]GLQ91162.1 hypothetical protein GCM10007901_01120 [Dyella acidisoli]